MIFPVKEFLSLCCLFLTLDRKLRDPWNNPGLLFNEVVSRSKPNFVKPKNQLRLSEDLHPTLKPQGDDLDKVVIRFKETVEKVLRRHGNVSKVTNFGCTVFALYLT